LHLLLFPAEAVGFSPGRVNQRSNSSVSLHAHAQEQKASSHRAQLQGALLLGDLFDNQKQNAGNNVGGELTLHDKRL
jgi:hypothetical protein